MKSIVTICLFICLSAGYTSHAQAVISNSSGMIYLDKNVSTSPNLEGKRGGYFGNHYLGDDIAAKYSKFMSYYMAYEKEKGAYATEKLIIYKKPIYDAVKDLDKNFKKAVKKGDITMDDAYERFDEILSIGIKVRFYRTVELESLLKSAESEEEMEDIFLNVRIQ